jgi:predicted PurR-regulated permease PerM
MERDNTIKYSLILITIIVFFWAIYHARAFLVPLSFAALLAMLMVPISNALERWGFRRTWSSLTSTLIIITIAAGVVLLLSSRASSFAAELPRLMERVTQHYQKVRQTVQNQWGIELPTQDDLLADKSSETSSDVSTTKEPEASSSGSAAGTARQRPPANSEASPANSASEGGATVSGSWFSSIMRTLTNIFTSTLAIVGDMLLTLVYVFTLLFYRDRFREFLCRLTPDAEHPRVTRLIDHTSSVARQYLWGRLLLIIVLAIFYGLGFFIIGLQNALFLAIFAALFDIIPYIGPIIGMVLPVLVALVSQNSPMLLLWVLAIFAVAQFVQSYILEPLIVGAEVHVNPFFTIVAVVAGSLLWGIPGLILAIPIVGIMRVIFDNFDSLQPYGYLIGQKETSQGGKK